MAARLAAEEPLFEPGTAHAYHAITVGWITSELMRRVTGQTLGSWFRDNVARPLDLNIQIGRSADANSPVAAVEVPDEHDSPEIDAASIAARAISLNGLFPARMSGLAAAMNDPDMQRVELAGANGVADARSLARLYSKAIGGGGETPLVSQDCLRDACRIVSSGTPLGQEFPGPTWGAGLMLPWAVQPMLGEGSFGHDGAGGSLAFAHAPSGVSFAYVRNRVGQPGIKDPQVYGVVDALARILGLSVPTF
jgi:CubicO group peptidase (beta-lactamase class C family)